MSIHRYPVSLLILIAIMSALTLSYPEHLGATYWTYTLSRWFFILHNNGPRISNFPLGAALHTICLHFSYLLFEYKY